MTYVCLVYGIEGSLQALDPGALARLDRDSLAYDRGLEAAGKLVVAQALKPVATAKSVRRRQGRLTVTDGPFAETKEQLLGFVMVEAATMDEAVALASGIPLAALGTVEVREIHDVAAREASAARA